MSELPPSSHKQRASTIAAATAFVVGILGAVGFATIYTLGEDQVEGMFIQALGVSLMIALFGLGTGLVIWAHAFMPQGPEVEEREFPAPKPSQRRDAVRIYRESTEAVGRRRLLGRLFFAAASAVGIAALFPLRSIAERPHPARERTSWRPGARVVTEDGEPVALDTLDVGGFLTVFPEGFERTADNQVILLRLPDAVVAAFEGREEWVVAGYVAFSLVCTHAGCPVGLYQFESQRLFCPCHQSAFDVVLGAEPVFGPAPRALPQLPLGLGDDGLLIALGDFEKPVGPGYWTYP